MGNVYTIYKELAEKTEHENQQLRARNAELLAALGVFVDAFGPFQRETDGEHSWWHPAGKLIATEIAEQARAAIAKEKGE